MYSGLVCAHSSAGIAFRFSFARLDTNRDGIQQSGESGNVDGVAISILNAAPDNTVLATTTSTAVNGYSFDSCTLGLDADLVYRIRIGVPVNGALLPTLPNRGGNDNADSDAVEAGATATITTDPSRYGGGSDDASNDFGLQPPASVRIGDFVWLDDNADGIQDAGEPGLSGVTIRLFGGTSLDRDSLPTELGRTVTDSNGAYVFDENQGVVKETDYTLVIELDAQSGTSVAFNQLAPSLEGQGGDATLDSNGVLDRGRSLVFTEVTTGGESSVDNSLDFGFHRKLVIGDFVWFDANFNGVQDAAAAEQPGGDIAGNQVLLELVKQV